MELSDGPKNRGLVEQPGSVLQGSWGCAEDARVRGGCGRRVAIACHRRRTGKRSGWAGTGRQMRGRRWGGILQQNLKKCPFQNKYIDDTMLCTTPSLACVRGRGMRTVGGLQFALSLRRSSHGLWFCAAMCLGGHPKLLPRVKSLLDDASCG